ncbi:hypothetical protein FOA52_003981 [Chlamydomonas sp. UWO 241]|nr:hypothetical protein FOA52_003981 [Chlamydomonas sp. UWO 241]
MDPTGSINAAVSKAAVQQEPDITAGSTLMLKQVFPSAAPAIQPAAIQPLVAHPPTRAMPATSGASNVRVEPLAATDAADDIFAYLGPPSQIFTALLSQQRPQQQAGGARPVPQAPAPTAAPRGPCGSSATQPSAVIQASALAATADQGARRRGDDGTAERAAVSAMDEVEDDGAEDEDDDAPTFNLLACSGGGALRDGKRPRPDAPRAGEHDENVPPMGSSQLPAKQQPGRQHHHLSQHQSQQQPACGCASCLRKSGPMRENSIERIDAIKEILFDYYSRDTTINEDQAKHKADKLTMKLWLMVEHNEHRELDAFLRSGEINDTDFIGDVVTEMIITATQMGNLELVKVLLDHDADIETLCSGRQGTPIMHAANNGHANIIKLLVSYGANVEARDMSNLSACMVAVNCDRPSAVDALLSAGAQVDAKENRRGQTALHLAASCASIDSIHLLVAASADVNMRDSEGNTPLDIANSGNRPHVIQALDQAGNKVRLQKVRAQRKQAGAESKKQMGEAELARREAEAAEAAADLLREEEMELQNAAVKKAKKGKGKKDAGGKAKDGVAATPAAVATGAAGASTSGVQDAAQPAHQASGSNGGSSNGGSFNPAQGSSKPQAVAPPVMLPVQPPVPPPVPPPAPVAAPAADPGPSTAYPADDPLSALRSRWEALLEVAANCVDEAQQPLLLRQVQDMLPTVAKNGIGVKYGRKTVQRLEAVAPVWDALRAAIASTPPVRTDLQVALAAAKPVRNLLDPALVSAAEALEVDAGRHAEEQRWNNLAAQLSWQQQGAADAGPSHCQAAAAPQVPANMPARSAAQALRPDGMREPEPFDAPPRAQGAAPQAASSAPSPTDDPDIECVICLSAPRSMCCIPCGHVCMCSDCSGEVEAKGQPCPMAG